jgi:hypothetical protein
LNKKITIEEGFNMQFDKTSIFYVAANGTLRVETIVSANGDYCRIDGQPMIEVDGEIVQVGCVRFTRASLAVLAHHVETKRGLIQAGDYKTADPNTRKDGAKFDDNTNGKGART